MSAIAWPFITIDADGVVWIEGTRTKVVEVALDRLAHHWDADEIHRQHPHLSLAQIYAALSYYYDHQTALDQVIDEQLARVAAARRRLENPVLRAKLTVQSDAP